MSELSQALQAQRAEIAGEVHDRVIPPLFAARMQLESLAARLNQPAEDAQGAGAATRLSDAVLEIQQAAALVETAMATSRQLLGALLPQQVSQEYWATQLQRAQGRSDVTLDQHGTLPWQRLEAETAVALTAIAEEAVRNAIRHGDPSRIEIRIEPTVDSSAAGSADTADRHEYQMTIIDDGKGFDPGAATSHHGLRLMRLRAKAVGGSLDITSQPGGPTKISVTWPASHLKSEI